MKKKRIMLTCVLMVWVILIGQFHIKASEIGENENKEAALDPDAIEVQESSEDEEELILETEPEESNSEEEMVTEEDKAEIAGGIEDGILLQDMEEKNLDSEDNLYYQGLLYYLNRYQNECAIVYLQACLEYAGIEEEISREMYDMGKITSAEVKSYEAKLALVKAQLTAAENQKSYNDLFLKEHGLDYSDYIIKEKKDVKSKEYYIEQYPEKNHMTMAGYVTSYKNAMVYMEAKQVEIEGLTMQADSARLLYDAGEISKLELKQQEVSLAKALYEQQQYYVEMNLAYVNLVLYCR